MKPRKTARDGAIAALAASRPGRPKQSRAEAGEIAKLTAEVERPSATVVEQAVELAALRGKAALRIGVESERAGAFTVWGKGPVIVAAV